jgi:hypothetical protein
VWRSPKNVSEQPEVTAQLCAAFPKDLQAEVMAALIVLPVSRLAPTSDDIGPVSLHGEDIHIPSRIYSSEPQPETVRTLRTVPYLLLGCLLSRHHDGYVRERYVQLLLGAKQFWIPPFVLQLVGEYIVEISILLLSRISELDADLYAEFAAENEEFVARTRRRVISYWDCYYRLKWPNIYDYPGFQVMQALKLWNRRDARRLLAR